MLLKNGTPAFVVRCGSVQQFFAASINKTFKHNATPIPTVRIDGSGITSKNSSMVINPNAIEKKLYQYFILPPLAAYNQAAISYNV